MHEGLVARSTLSLTTRYGPAPASEAEAEAEVEEEEEEEVVPGTTKGDDVSSSPPSP